MAVVTGSGRPQVLIDGSQLFTAKAAIAELSAAAAKAAVNGPAGGQASQPGSQPQPVVTVLYNPELNTSDIMIPGLAGVSSSSSARSSPAWEWSVSVSPGPWNNSR